MITDPRIASDVSRLTQALIVAQQQQTVRPVFRDSWLEWARKYQGLEQLPQPVGASIEARIRRRLDDGWIPAFRAEFLSGPAVAAGAVAPAVPLRINSGVPLRKAPNYGSPNSAPPHTLPMSLTHLLPGEGLVAGPGGPGTGSALQSPSGQFTLSMRADGNLSLWDNLHAQEIWNAGTFASADIKAPGALFVLQPDGNLVIYDTNGRPMWAANSNGKGACLLRVQDDGNLCLQTAADSNVWSSDTWQQPQNIQPAAAAVPPPPPPAPPVATQAAPAAPAYQAPPLAQAPAAAAPAAAPVAAAPAPVAAAPAAPAPAAATIPAAPVPQPLAAPATSPAAPYQVPALGVASPPRNVSTLTVRQELDRIPGPVKLAGVVGGLWLLSRGGRL